MKTINFKLTNGYKIKSLCINDWKTVFKLCEKYSDYYILHYGILPAIKNLREIFKALPTNKGYEDKLLLGVFTSYNKLISIVDFIRDFPAVGEWMLGLMLIDPDKRSIGIGKIVHRSLSK